MNMTYEEAIGHAARLLKEAEMETDLKRMERLEGMSDSWRAIAGLCFEHARSM